eukprot:GHRQ01034468.1.p1 GENE.GHRQ01034468.1~~GHRQ01034468.1.p1  ORF type:complete len:139 (+),score=53.60 GHRQ01034468.1:1-417(+)
MLRADFRLFDEYTPSSSSSSSNSSSSNCSQSSSRNPLLDPAPSSSGCEGPTPRQQQCPFSFPMRLFWGKDDRRVSPAMVQGWASYTSGTCSSSGIDGNHLFPLQPAAKQRWLTQVAQALAEALCCPQTTAGAPAGPRV